MATQLCVYCNRPAFTAGWVRPNLCEPHFEMAIIRANLTRQGKRLTAGSAAAAVAERKAKKDGYEFSFTADQIPALVDQMNTEDIVYIPALPVPALA